MTEQSNWTKEQICPIYSVLDVIAAKWTVEILREVSLQPTRTRQFLARIPGLSMKCLVARLKELQRHGMIERTDYEGRSPHVEYSVTERGLKLFDVLIAIKELASDWREISCKCPMDKRYRPASAQSCLYDKGGTACTFECPLRRTRIRY